MSSNKLIKIKDEITSKVFEDLKYLKILYCAFFITLFFFIVTNTFKLQIIFQSFLFFCLIGILILMWFLKQSIENKRTKIASINYLLSQKLSQ